MHVVGLAAVDGGRVLVLLHQLTTKNINQKMIERCVAYEDSFYEFEQQHNNNINIKKYNNKKQF